MCILLLCNCIGITDTVQSYLCKYVIRQTVVCFHFSSSAVTHTMPSHISTEYVKYGGNLSLVLDNFTKGAEGCLKWKFSQRLGYPGVNLPPNVALSNDAKANDSHVTITTATMKNQGFYTCYHWNQQAHVTQIIVNGRLHIVREQNFLWGCRAGLGPFH